MTVSAAPLMPHARSTERARRTALAALAATAVLTLAACAPADQPASEPSAGQAVTTPEQALTELGLSADQPVEELVSALEDTHRDRELGLMGSVTPESVQLTVGQEQLAVPLAEDRFYLSVAPFETTTHECFLHSLAGCQGELVDQEMTVTFTDARGEVLVDEQRTSYTNGFVGLWLPADTTGTLTVEVDGRSGSQQVSTGAEDPTCLTTLQVS